MNLASNTQLDLPSPAPFAPVLAILFLAGGYGSPSFRKGTAFTPALILAQLSDVYLGRKVEGTDLLGWSTPSEPLQFPAVAQWPQENFRRFVEKWPKKAIRILDCILMPLLEEAVFCGFLQPSMKRMTGQLLPQSGATALVVLADSLLFGLSHLEE